MLIIIAVCMGFLGSFVSGLLGGGAGLIFVPTIYWLISHTYPGSSHLMQTTITTGSTIAIPLGLVASWRQFRYQGVDFVMFKRSVFCVVAGSLLGVCLMDVLHSQVIKWFFIVMIFATAFWLWRYRAESARHWQLKLLPHNLMGGAIGLVSMLMGVAIFTVPFFVKLGLDIQKPLHLR